MKKFEFVLIALAILGVAIFYMMIMAKTPDDGAQGVTPTGVATIWPGMVENQTAIRIDHVIDIAQSDLVVQKILSSCDNVSGPVYMPPGKTDVYLYDKERYAGVVFNATAGPSYTAPGSGQISLKVIVDVDNMTEMGVLYRGMAYFMYSWIIIPPGNGISEMMSAGHFSPDNKDTPEIGSSIGSFNATPKDAKLCPVVVDEDNYTRFVNGSSYEVPSLIDPDTSAIVRLDGTISVSSGLKSVYELPPDRLPCDEYGRWSTWYYMILLNKETDKEIKIVFTTPFPAIYEY